MKSRNNWALAQIKKYILAKANKNITNPSAEADGNDLNP